MKKKKSWTRACAKPNQTNLGLETLVAGDRGNPSWKRRRRKGTHGLLGAGAAGRTSGQLDSGQPPWARPPPLCRSGGCLATPVARRSNGSDGPIRKSGANHCGDGDGSLTSLSSGLWGPSPSRIVGQPGPPSPEGPSVATRDGRLRAAGTKGSSCQPRQPARSGRSPDTGCR